MPPIRRTIKNVVHNFSDSQIKVREATSNDPWGPSSTLMAEIADLTYNVVAFSEIMQVRRRVWVFLLAFRAPTLPFRRR